MYIMEKCGRVLSMLQFKCAAEVEIYFFGGGGEKYISRECDSCTEDYVCNLDNVHFNMSEPYARISYIVMRAV